MLKPSEVVDKLLEAVAVCAACQKEFGISPGPDETHGICKRHAVNYYTDMFGDREKAVQHLAHKPEGKFAPDLSRQSVA